MGHFGTKLIVEKIIEEGYWWPKMRATVAEEIGKCDACLQYNIQREGYHPARSIVAKHPWDHIQIDLIGPLPTSDEGFSF